MRFSQSFPQSIVILIRRDLDLEHTLKGLCVLNDMEQLTEGAARRSSSTRESERVHGSVWRTHEGCSRVALL